jgi:hypothetical protein
MLGRKRRPKMRQPVCRGLRPEMEEKGTLVVEEGVCMRVCISQHTTLTPDSPKDRWSDSARSDQSAGHAEPLVIISSFAVCFLYPIVQPVIVLPTAQIHLPITISVHHQVSGGYRVNLVF